MSAITAGPRCDECGKTEQACARAEGCCDGCTHWADLDCLGNSIGREIRRAERAHGNEDAYQDHLLRGSQPCTPCRRAHRQHRVQELAAMVRDPYHFDPLYQELIPVRITPAPSTGRGPSALWVAVERQRDLWALAHDDNGESSAPVALAMDNGEVA